MSKCSEEEISWFASYIPISKTNLLTHRLAGSEKFDWAEVRIAFTDPKLYMR